MCRPQHARQWSPAQKHQNISPPHAQQPVEAHTAMVAERAIWTSRSILGAAAVMRSQDVPLAGCNPAWRRTELQPPARSSCRRAMASKQLLRFHCLLATCSSREETSERTGTMLGPSVNVSVALDWVTRLGPSESTLGDYCFSRSGTRIHVTPDAPLLPWLFAGQRLTLCRDHRSRRKSNSGPSRAPFSPLISSSSFVCEVNDAVTDPLASHSLSHILTLCPRTNDSGLAP